MQNCGLTKISLLNEDDSVINGELLFLALLIVEARPALGAQWANTLGAAVQ